MLINAGKLKRAALAKNRSKEVREELERKMVKLDMINAAKASNKHGLFNRL